MEIKASQQNKEGPRRPSANSITANINIVHAASALMKWRDVALRDNDAQNVWGQTKRGVGVEIAAGLLWDHSE